MLRFVLNCQGRLARRLKGGQSTAILHRPPLIVSSLVLLGFFRTVKASIWGQVCSFKGWSTLTSICHTWTGGPVSPNKGDTVAYLSTTLLWKQISTAKNLIWLQCKCHRGGLNTMRKTGIKVLSQRKWFCESMYRDGNHFVLTCKCYKQWLRFHHPYFLALLLNIFVLF